MTTKSHLEVIEYPSDGKKTKFFEIVSAHDSAQLGIVKWHGAWRQYVFHPNTNCIWSHDCLAELSQFIKNLMNARKLEGAKK